MELSLTQKLQSLPQRPKRLQINKNWNTKNYACNYYTIHFKHNLRNIYQYSFQCEPPFPEESRQLLIQVIKNAQKQLKDQIGLFSYKGNMVWGLKKSKSTVTTVQSFVKLGLKGEQKTIQKHLVHLKIARVFDLDKDSFITDFGKKILQVLNIKFKQSLRNMNYIQITRNKYFTMSQLEQEKDNIIADLNVRALRGFSFTFVPLIKHDLKARLNFSLKYIHELNFLQVMNQCGSKDAQKQLIGRYVLAYYGNYKLYKIQDIDYEKSPLSQFSLQNQQKKITYKDYFFYKYNKKITKLNQPLLKVITKIDKKKLQNGKFQKIPSYGYMVPQLVKLSGVTDDQAMKKQFKEIIKKSRKSPQQTYVACEEIRQNFIEINKDSVFQIGQQLQVKGYQLPRIVYKTTSKEKQCINQEINVLQQILNPMNLEQKTWIIVYGQQNYITAKNVVESMKFAQKKLGISISDPKHIQINGHGQKNFIQKVRQQIKEYKAIFILVILNRNEEGYYGSLKRLFVNELNIASQILKSNTIYSKIKMKKSILPIVTKLLLQINAKLGLPIWKIIKKHEYWKQRSVIYCAINTKRSMKHHSTFNLTLVGTSDNQMTQFYSDYKFQLNKIDGKLPQKQLIALFTDWIKLYLQNQKYLPDSIIVYKQGSNQYQAVQECQTQISALKQAIQTCSKQHKIKPSIVFIHVNKRTQSKFYETQIKGKNKFYQNPLPGTVILEEISQGQSYDFYLMAQKINQGTAIPTHYKVLYDDSQIPQDALVELTHQQCYNYANWAGPVKVPSCVQYVSKLSSLMSEYMKEGLYCNEKFKRSLFFL